MFPMLYILKYRISIFTLSKHKSFKTSIFIPSLHSISQRRKLVNMRFAVRCSRKACYLLSVISTERQRVEKSICKAQSISHPSDVGSPLSKGAVWNGFLRALTYVRLVEMTKVIACHSVRRRNKNCGGAWRNLCRNYLMHSGKSPYLRSPVLPRILRQICSNIFIKSFLPSAVE